MTTEPAQILLVDDNPANLQVLYATLGKAGTKLFVAKSGEAALKIAGENRLDLVLLDINMPGIDGYETCRRIKSRPETAELPIIFLSALSATEDKVRGFELGAVDYVAKPFEAAELVARVETHLTLHRLKRELALRNARLARELQVARDLLEEANNRVAGALLGQSTAVRELRRRIARHALGDAPLTLSGPPGCGAEAVARAVHRQSERRERPFLTVDPLLEQGRDHLFPPRSGDQAGASRFELAVHGSLYIDRVNSLDSDQQRALIEVLRDQRRARERGRAPLHDVRIIASLPRRGGLIQGPQPEPELLDLLLENVAELPSLAERQDDLSFLVTYLIQRQAHRLGKKLSGLDADSLERLKAYPWPGNLRELHSIIERASLLAAGPELRIPEDLLYARSVGGFQLLERLSSGGMGEIWTARHRLLASPAAVKLIRSDALADPSTRAEAQARFEREARATARLLSPNTVKLYDFGVSEDGAFYYVMQRLRGLDLELLVKRFGPMPAERVIYLLRQACRSLGEAHDSGLVHRDIKPANLFVCKLGLEYDFLKVLDFGIVRGDPEDDGKLTGQGNFVGTASTIAPEIVMGRKDYDGRADLYSLACVAFWLLTGKVLFDGANSMSIVVKHATEKPTAPSAVTENPIPRALEAIVMRCLEKNPMDRPRDAHELWRALGAVELQETWDQDRAEEWWRARAPETLADQDEPPPR